MEIFFNFTIHRCTWCKKVPPSVFYGDYLPQIILPKIYSGKIPIFKTYTFLLLASFHSSFSASMGLTDHQRDFQKVAADFAKNELAPEMMKWDQEVIVDNKFYKF